MAKLIGITFDCEDPQRLARFWAAALDDYMTSPQETSLKSVSGTGPAIYFQQVPEPKTGKNRVHLDLTTADARGDQFRLERMGAKVIEEKAEGGHDWTVMGDIEGNEFCLVKGV